MVAYVHIEYSTYQLSEESKGRGMESNPPPLRSLRYPKKRGTEKVKGVRLDREQYSKFDFFQKKMFSLTRALRILSYNALSTICTVGPIFFQVKQ